MADNHRILFVTDEADAVIHILGKRAGEQPIQESDWQPLFSSDGYVRLKEREASIERPFSEDDFRAFVNSADLLTRREALKQTLVAWQGIHLHQVADRSLAYLPAGTPLDATIYPVIKPKTNSFVFDLDKDPAIFLYLDAEIRPDQLENILAHELHHIGMGSIQLGNARSDEWEALPDATRQMRQWLGAFGEGIAMLAAAGSAEVHPHACSSPEDRERWDESLANFAADFRAVEAFLLDVQTGRLSGRAMQEAGFRFFGIQGPWYTVGWQMAVTIERKLGRTAVITAFCDPAQLLVTYNRAAGPDLPHWDPRLYATRQE